MAQGKRRAGREDPTSQVSQTLAPARRASRAAERERRRAQRRTRRTVAIATGVALLVGVLAVVVGGAVRRGDKPDPPKARTQRTLLFQVTRPDGAARAAALLAYDPAPDQASLVLIPPHTLIDVAGLGNVVVQNAVRLGGPDVAREAVSDMLGITVDSHWTLTERGFVTIVDRVGGVVVDVDVDVTTAGPRGATNVLLRAGPQQRLDGATALAYATYVVKGQDEVTFQVRLQAVLDALVAALPADRELASPVLGSAGSEARLSWDTDDLATFLLGLRGAQSTDRYDPQVLPVTSIETGDGVPTYAIRVDEVANLVRAQLAASVPAGRDDGNNRVLVLNGVGTPGLGGSVADKLRDSPYRIVGTRNKQGFGERVSVVVVFDPSEPSLAKARAVAALLGLPPESVRIGTQTQSVADLIVVIGADYKP
ncbi:MAG TPA: LCP family protein [Frankiaceae bacterium]|jgi:LCP family protein required for cell wall assembly|nr:LCP family protein [Frankiaceae bacterium]